MLRDAAWCTSIAHLPTSYLFCECCFFRRNFMYFSWNKRTGSFLKKKKKSSGGWQPPAAGVKSIQLKALVFVARNISIISSGAMITKTEPKKKANKPTRRHLFRPGRHRKQIFANSTIVWYCRRGLLYTANVFYLDFIGNRHKETENINTTAAAAAAAVAGLSLPPFPTNPCH